MRGLGILLLIVLFFSLCWPRISRWLKRKAMERADDYLRNAMGMPPREKPGKKNRKNNFGREKEYDPSAFYSRRKRSDNGNSRESIIPKEYAEDVEFVETKSFSSSTEYTKTENSESYHESQISDAEWTEIKNTSANKK